jgi:hypothetical protein
VPTGQKLLDSLAETWDFFFSDVLPTLQAIFYPVQVCSGRRRGSKGTMAHRMALGRTPALTTPSVLAQAVPCRPAEPSRRVTPRGLEGLEWGMLLAEICSAW